MTTYLDRDKLLVLRTARKAHRCVVHRQPHRYAPSGIVCPLPGGGIVEGTQYVEYFGEAHPYKGGDPFCLTCARAEWSDYLTTALPEPSR